MHYDANMKKRNETTMELENLNFNKWRVFVLCTQIGLGQAWFVHMIFISVTKYSEILCEKNMETRILKFFLTPNKRPPKITAHGRLIDWAAFQ